MEPHELRELIDNYDIRIDLTDKIPEHVRNSPAVQAWLAEVNRILTQELERRARANDK
jgi:hypothetical protein